MKRLFFSELRGFNVIHSETHVSDLNILYFPLEQLTPKRVLAALWRE
jgi:hypothetical protein